MDKLITTYTGKMPLVLEDLNWLDQTYRSALNDLFKDFPVILEANCIVSGCAYSEAGGVTTVQSGWVLILNELIYFEGDSITGTAENCKITYEDSYDAAGAKVFANGTSHNVYFKRRGKLVLNTGQVYARVIGERLIDRVRGNGLWQTPTLEEPYVNNGLKYKKMGDTVVLSGSFSVPSTYSFGSPLFTLPSGFRPPYEVQFPCTANATTFHNSRINIQTDGTVYYVCNDFTFSTGLVVFTHALIPNK